ncbi:MAG: hypothetical protein IKR67_02720 [Lachnospiraceae bacterium]|nr:hypothetical protein [Lachnospiraceae bacterium]
MHKSIKQYIKKISTVNLIFPVIICIIMVVLLLVIPSKNVFSPTEATSIGQIKEIYSKDEGYVDFSIDDLLYTGYDYYSGSTPVASYYYSVDANSGSLCAFFLIPLEKGQSPQEVINHYSAKAKLVDDDKYFSTFLAAYASDIGWSTQGLIEASGGFLVSDPDYHPEIFVITRILIYIVLLLCGISILANIIVFFVPHLHHSCRRLRIFGLDGSDVSYIDRELVKNVVIEEDNIVVTDHFLVIFGKNDLCMVPLFNIIWTYRYNRWHPLRSKDKMSYSINIITSPKDKITMHGCKKKSTDAVLKFLDEEFSHITVGYSDEIREEMEKLI